MPEHTEQQFAPTTLFAPDTGHGWAEWHVRNHEVTVYTDGSFDVVSDGGDFTQSVEISAELFDAMVKWRQEHRHG